MADGGGGKANGADHLKPFYGHQLDATLGRVRGPYMFWHNGDLVAEALLLWERRLK